MSAARDGRKLYRCTKCGDQTLQEVPDSTDAVAICGPCWMWFDEKIVLEACTREARIIKDATGMLETTPIDFFPDGRRRSHRTDER